jgi:hypothetical protein
MVLELLNINFSESDRWVNIHLVTTLAFSSRHALHY